MTRRLTTLLAVALAAVATAPLAQAKVGQPRTATANYDRGESVVEAGTFTYLFFARTKDPCDRLAGCNPDNAFYDVYFKVSPDGGKTYGPDHFAAANPVVGPVFFGRTLAAAETVEGTPANPVLYVFWASGGNGSQLYYLRGDPQGDGTTFTGPKPVPGVPPTVFNVEALTLGSSIYVYTEEFDPTAARSDIWAREYGFDGADLVLQAGPTLVAKNKNLPKGIVDNQPVQNRFKLTMVDSSAYPTVDVYVTESPDGLVWPQPPPALVPVVHEACVGNWDPQLAELPNGRYYLHFAPDHTFSAASDGSCVETTGTEAGRQRIGLTTSNDFVHWSAPRDVSPGFTAGDAYWDYWPEAFVLGNKLTLYYTSERGFDVFPNGIGHIWTVPGDGGLDVNQAPNGSFETSTTGLAPDRWTASGSTAWVQGGTLGKRAVTAGALGSWTSDPIAVTPGASYGAMADVVGSGRVVVEQLAADGSVLGPLTDAIPGGTAVFQAVDDAFTIASGVTSVRIRLEGGLVGTTTFDDVRLWQQ